MATLGLAFAQPGVLPPALQWPAGELNCAHGYREFDALHQKEVYYVGVHAPAGIDTAWREFNLTFEEYLDRTVGDRWVPPIRFKMKPTVDPLRDWVDRQEDVDFMYSDTGLYSCIGVEIGGQPLGTTISHLTARGRSYNLDIYGGKFWSVIRILRLGLSGLILLFPDFETAQGVSLHWQPTKKSIQSVISRARSLERKPSPTSQARKYNSML